MLLRVEHIAKYFGDQQVLNDVSLHVARGHKLALVGANGAGKSTLLNILVGQLSPDAGQVTLAHGADLGYLPQTLTAPEGQTVQGLIDASLGELRELEQRLRRLEERMASGHDLDNTMAEYGLLAERFEQRGGYALEHRLEHVLAGLHIEHIDRTHPFATLSGGEKSRVGLAALLLRNPDLLLLDEPTNHLDFAALEWLETYLQTFSGGVLVVSHDRDFLNRTADAIVEVQEYDRTARHYSGNYDFYAQVKAQERTRWVQEYTAQQEEIWELRRAIKGKARQVAHNRPPRDNDKFLAAFKEGRVQDTIARNVRAAEEKLHRIEQDPIPRPPRELQFNSEFDPAELANHIPVVASQLCKGYAAHRLLDGVDFAVQAQSRIVIVGPNGAGKSTLLKLIAGQIQPDAGEINLAASVRLGYLDQEQDTLDPAQTVFEAFRAGRAGNFEEFKAELLSLGLFTYPEIGKRVDELSVGQKRKLQIAQLITGRANLLLLDEPTNHISLDVLEAFETALHTFAGPIIAVSHDRRFIKRFAHEVWTLQSGKLIRYLGGWESYREAHSSIEIKES